MSRAPQVWIAAGLDGVGDAYAVTDAVTAVTRATLHAGGSVHLWNDPTLAPLVVAIAREHGALDRVHLWSDALPQETRGPLRGFTGWRTAPAIAAAMHAAGADASFIIGGGEAVRSGFSAAGRLAAHDRWVLARTGGDARGLRSSSTAPPLIDEIRELMATSETYPFIADLALRWVADRIAPLPQPRVSVAGLRRVLGNRALA